MAKESEEGVIKIVTGKASLELRPNGDIFVNEKRAENDKAVVQGMRDLIREFLDHSAERRNEKRNT